MNVLLITNRLNHADGVSSQLFYLLKNLRSNYGLNLCLITAGGDAIEKFKDLGLEIIFHENLDHNKRSVVNFAKAIKFVYRIIKDNDIDIVHSHNHYAANIAQKAVKFVHATTIQSVHGIIENNGRLNHYPADKFIAVNDHVAKFLIRNDIEAERINLIYNGIDFEITTPQKAIQDIKVISAARLEKGKGLETYIKAVAKIGSATRNRAKFFLAGSGSLESELRNLNTSLKSGIEFIGNKKNLLNELSSSHIFVISSESEGLPITMLEAASQKNLIISSDFAGVHSIIETEKDGLIFRVNDPDELCSKIEHAIDNMDLSIQMAENFHVKASSTFNASTMAEKYFQVYSIVSNKA